MKFEDYFIYVIPIFVTTIMLGVVFNIVLDIGNSFSNVDRDAEKIAQKELQYCARFDMRSIDYIFTANSLFGSRQIDSVKCINDDGEKLIDYHDDSFCELQVKSIWKKC